jgi:hypothetical protein
MLRARAMTPIVIGLLLLGSVRAEGTGPDPATSSDGHAPPLVDKLASIMDDPDPVGRFVVDRTEGAGVPDGREADVVVDPVTGERYAVWVRPAGAARSRAADADANDIFVSRSRGSRWTLPSLVARTVESESDPVLAIDGATHTVHLVYRVVESTTPATADAARIFHRQAPADLSAWSEPALVSSVAEHAAPPAAAIHEGRLFVVYGSGSLQPDSGPRLVVVAERRGALWASQAIGLSHVSARPSLVETAAEATLDAVWSDGDSLVRKRLGPDGRWFDLGTIGVESPEVPGRPARGHGKLSGPLRTVR